MLTGIFFSPAMAKRLPPYLTSDFLPLTSNLETQAKACGYSLVNRCHLPDLHIQVLYLFCMRFDKPSPRLYLISHQDSKYPISKPAVLKRHLKDCPCLRVHGGLPQLSRIHLPKPLVSLYVEPLPAHLHHKIKECRRGLNGLLLILDAYLVGWTAKTRSHGG